MTGIQSVPRWCRSGRLIMIIAALLAVEMTLLPYIVTEARMARQLSRDELRKMSEEGVCINKKNDSAVGDACAGEITDKLAELYQKSEGEGTSSSSLFEICVTFNGFKSMMNDTMDCRKIYCFDLKKSTTFWVIMIGVPVCLIIAFCVIVWLCCNFSYYMCCCCIFNKKEPSWFKKMQTKAKVTPAQDIIKEKKARASGASGGAATDKDKDASKEKDAVKDKDMTTTENDADKGKDKAGE